MPSRETWIHATFLRVNHSGTSIAGVAVAIATMWPVLVADSSGRRSTRRSAPMRAPTGYVLSNISAPGAVLRSPASSFWYAK